MVFTRRTPPYRFLRCTLCGREITRGEEYWACNGCLACGECLPELARRELSLCREVCGEEGCL